MNALSEAICADVCSVIQSGREAEARINQLDPAIISASQWETLADGSTRIDSHSTSKPGLAPAPPTCGTLRKGGRRGKCG